MAALVSLVELRSRLGSAVLDTAHLRPGRLPAGVAGLDGWLGGWPTPGITEITGAVGTGRLALVVPALARLTRQGSSVVLVDPLHQVHPPGLPELDAAHVVLVRPPADQAAWVVEQVARSGAVEAMVVVDPPPLGRVGQRLARAADAGGMVCFVVTGTSDPEVPAALRLVAEGWTGGGVRVHCTRSRNGRQEGRRLVRL